MQYGCALIALGVVQIVLARAGGPTGWLLVWSGASWIVAGCGYAFLGAKIFGKRSDGQLTLWNALLLLPFLVVTWLLWHLQTALSREPHHVEIAPDLWLGRRCYGRELPPKTSTVVDLTAEFPETKAVCEGRTYLCLPTLDASVPSLSEFAGLIESVPVGQGPIYIHCALGHGRSAMVAVAILVHSRAAVSLDEAERRVTEARPGVKINFAQRALLGQWIDARALRAKRDPEKGTTM